MPNLAPGARCTSNGLPPGCVQIPVYGHYHPSRPWEADEIRAFFLVDSQFAQALIKEPKFGKWHLELYASHTYAVWLDPPNHGEKAFRHRLHYSVWALAGHVLGPGDYLRWRNFDEYDNRIENLACFHSKTLHSDTVAVPGIRLIDHDNDRVSARLGSTSY